MSKKWLFISLACGVFSTGLGASYYLAYSRLPSFEVVKQSYQPSDLLLLDSQQRVVQATRWNYEKRNLVWTSLKDISPSVQAEILRAEDQRFFKHPGVDLLSVAGSVNHIVKGHGVRGASTVSMQLVKILERRPQASILSKALQMWKALVLETKWSKQEILEAYLNLIPLRGEVMGVRAAANIFFQKNPNGLNQIEAVLIATQVRAPNASQEKWIQRSCAHQPGLCEESRKAIQNFKMSGESGVHEQEAFEYSQFLKKAGYKGVVSTDIHRDLQIFIRQQVQLQLMNLKKENVSEAAVLVLENRTGRVWAYVGNSAAGSYSNYIDGVRSYRQAGSTLKPFLYAESFEKRILDPDSQIEDSPLEINLDRGVYRPRNHDLQHHGWVTAAQALGSSLNVPAVKVMQMLPEGSLHRVLRDLGFSKLLTAEHYGPALALGVADVSLWDLTNAYRTLAQNGLYSEVQLPGKEKVSSSQQVFSQDVSKKVSQIMRTNSNRSLGFGLDSILNSVSAAVKTGTSKDMRDNWCVGFNQDFTVGVWVGNFNGEPMRNVMGVSGAAPIWTATMKWLEEKFPSKRDDSLAREDLKVGEEGSGDLAQQPLRVVYPTSGSIIALDPEIPEAQQRIPLMSSRIDLGMQWKVNGQLQSLSDKTVMWKPKIGKNRIELFAADGQLIDSVEVIVR